MVKHLMISIGFFAVCNMTFANVTILDNAELASVVVETQLEQLQPVLPQYNSNGQIGVAATQTTPVVGVVTPVANFNLGPTPPPLDLPPDIQRLINKALILANQSR